MKEISIFSRHKKYSIYFLISLFLVSCGANISGFIDVQNLIITDFKICTSNLYKENAIDSNQYCGNLFEDNVSVLYACGQIDAKNFNPPKNYVLLNIYLYKDQIKQPIYENPITDKFYDADFCRKIELPPDHRVGDYNVKIYFQRYIAAASNFTIK